jgi:imidazolonepropionase-like amidohydrolase
VVSGETLIAKTRGNTVDDAVIVPRAMLAATLGDGALKEDHHKVPGTRAKAAAILRQKLVDAAEYKAKLDSDQAKGRDLGLESLVRVLDGEVPLMVTAHRHNDLMTALRLREEFGFRLVLDGGAEAYTLTGEIAAAGVPVLVHPTMMRAYEETENATMENAALLREAGIAVALTGGYEDYVPKARVVLFEAGVAAAHGLGFDGALAAVTRDAAEILGIADRVGTLEVGKDGDLALYDGDPFEYTTHCTGTVIEGVVVSEGEWYEDMD